MKGVERMKRTWSTVVLVICIACALTIAGCGGGGSDSGTSWYGGGDGGGATTTPQITAVNNMDLPGQPVRVGDWIQIQGSGFGSTRLGTSSDGYVAFSDGTVEAKAVNFGQWSDTLVECQVPQGTPIKALIFKGSVSIGVVPANFFGGGSSYSINANPTPNPTPQPTPPSPSPSPSPTGTATPSPSPTPTPSPSLSPTPSPSPTSGGGGGGGGAAPTIVSVKVTPESAVIGHKNSPSAVGQDNGAAATQEFTAKAKYSDGSEVDVTTTCTWTTTSTVGEVGGATGIFTAGVTKKYIEQAEVKATYGGKEGTAKITVGLVNVPGQTIATDPETLLEGVTISEFYAGQYEITNADYCEFLNAMDLAGNNNLVEDGEKWWDDGAIDAYNGIIYTAGSAVGSRYTINPGFSARPVVYVSWYGAVAYCNWLTEKHGLGASQCCYGGYAADGKTRWGKDGEGNPDGSNYHPDRTGYRLATDAEWEYACRGNPVSTGDYYWSAVIGALMGDYCWYSQANHQNVGLLFPTVLAFTT